MLEYSHSNEDLRAIVHGLDLSLDDKVLAICGSGDQAFAMLEKAGKVVAVDTNKSQLTYAIERLKHLKNGNHSRFVLNRPDQCFDLRNNQSYFDKRRFKKIRSKINSLTIIKSSSDIFSYTEEDNFTRIYLSNALSYGYNTTERKRVISSFVESLHKIARKPRLLRRG